MSWEPPVSWPGFHLSEEFLLHQKTFTEKLCFKLHVRYYTKNSEMTRCLLWKTRLLTSILNNVINTTVERCIEFYKSTEEQWILWRWASGIKVGKTPQWRRYLSYPFKTFILICRAEEGFWAEDILFTKAPEIERNQNVFKVQWGARHHVA